MPKKLLLLLSLLFPLFVMSQSKFNIELTSGLLLIQKDNGLNASLGVSYSASPRIDVGVHYIFSEMSANSLDLNYKFNAISLHTEYAFIPENYLGLAGVFGFSYLMFDKALVLENNNSIGIDLGLKLMMNNTGKVNYGMKIINTYSSDSFGGIINNTLFLKYNF